MPLPVVGSINPVTPSYYNSHIHPLRIVHVAVSAQLNTMAEVSEFAAPSQAKETVTFEHSCRVMAGPEAVFDAFTDARDIMVS